MRNCPYDCVIGTDFLKDLDQVTFDFKRNVLKLPGQLIVPLVESNLDPDKNSIFTYAMLNETRSLPPGLKSC